MFTRYATVEVQEILEVKGSSSQIKTASLDKMSGYEDYVAERIIPATKIFDADTVIEDYTKTRRTEGKLKGPRCPECAHFQACEGPWREYPEMFGWDEFVPVRRA